MNPKNLIFSLLIFAVTAFVVSCERDWNNPWDEFNNLSPDAWAPQNLQIEDVSPVEKKLTWTYGDYNIEGFKIDRKKGNEPWQVAYQSFPKETRNWSDTEIIPDTSLTYEFRIYAFAGKNSSTFVEKKVSSHYCGTPFTDERDGHQYETIQIGTQCWMKENLAYLPSVSPSSNGSQTSIYYYVYGYEGTNVTAAKATANYQTYGVLYNWPASITACPDGWHLPSDAEWTTLTTYLGGESVAGGKMKETGTTHWQSPNTSATNSSGFTALPGGYRYINGTFYTISDNGNWWSSTENSATNAWHRCMTYNVAYVNRINSTKGHGFSVRCLRD